MYLLKVNVAHMFDSREVLCSSRNLSYKQSSSVGLEENWKNELSHVPKVYTVATSYNSFARNLIIHTMYFTPWQLLFISVGHLVIYAKNFPTIKR